MKAEQAAKIVGAFRWDLLRSLYGCAHSSIIGFVSTMWISQSEDHTVLDGAPSPITGGQRLGQKNADVLLCKADRPFIVVEVETNVARYHDKLKSVQAYMQGNVVYTGIELGMMVMTNLCKGAMKYKHNWDEIRGEIANGGNTIALVSIEKARVPLDESVLGRLRSRNDYYPWEIANIEYWVHDSAGATVEGRLLTV